MSLIQKYNQKKRKSVETPLPVGGLLYSDKLPSMVKVYPFTVQTELKHFESLRQMVEQNLPLQFIMFDDIIDDIVQGQNDEPIDTNYLTLQDIQFIIHTQRMLTFGSEMKVRIQCDNCRKFYIEQKNVDDEKKLDKLIKKYHMKPILKQELLKGDSFYMDEVIIDISKYQMDTPTTKEDILNITFTTTQGITLYFTLPRLGIYRVLKNYLLDFRKVIEDVYEPNNLSIPNNLEDEYEVYSQFQNVQLFLNKIEDDIISESNISEVPVFLKNSLTKKDLEDINDLISDLGKYILKIPYTYKCPRCGETKEVDGMQFHFEFIFNERSQI